MSPRGKKAKKVKTESKRKIRKTIARVKNQDPRNYEDKGKK